MSVTTDSENSSFVDFIWSHIINLLELDFIPLYLQNKLDDLKITLCIHSTEFQFHLDDVQWNLLIALFCVLSLNFLCVFVIWRLCCGRICQRFEKQVSSTVIEDLKRSVAQLKLPKVHSPRV